MTRCGERLKRTLTSPIHPVQFIRSRGRALVIDLVDTAKSVFRSGDWRFVIATVALFVGIIIVARVCPQRENVVIYTNAQPHPRCVAGIIIKRPYNGRHTTGWYYADLRDGAVTKVITIGPLLPDDEKSLRKACSALQIPLYEGK